jgi:hypothetical protein
MPLLFEVEVKTPEISQMFQEIAMQFGYSVGGMMKVRYTECKYIHIWEDIGMTIDTNQNKSKYKLVSIADAVNYFATGNLPLSTKFVKLGTYKAEVKQDGSLEVGCQTITKDQINNLLNAMNGKTYIPWTKSDADIPF